MLTDPASEIEMGDIVTGTLEVEKAGTVTIAAEVTSYNSSPMPMEGSQSPMQ
jgi:copper(I)-binding protein